MNKRVVLAASLAILSAVSLIPQANAAPATQDVEFNGTVVGTCTFSNTQPGTLGYTSGFSRVESSAGIPGLGGAASGQTTVNCNSSAQLTTSVPVAISVPSGFSPTRIQSIVYDGTNFTTAYNSSPYDSGAWTKPTSPIAIPAGTNVPLVVGMIAGTPGNSYLPAGTYQYRVTLTATPN